MVLSDIDERRLGFAKNLLPDAKLIHGDIREVSQEIINEVQTRIGDDDFILSITPPCQGMSQNGINTIIKATRSGKRPQIDERNYLIKPALEVAKSTKPQFIFFENVPAALNTYLYIDEQKVKFTDYLVSELESMGYKGKLKVVNFADYGTPQNRKRLVGIFTNVSNLDIEDIFPKSNNDTRTVRSAIGGLPPIDAKTKSSSVSSFHPLHKVPVLRKELYDWVANTKEGTSALENNKCRNCEVQNTTPDLHCRQCGEILDKPHVVRDGVPRVIKGYNSSYRRLKWDKPANTVTTRSAFASSAYNLHPEQNRVLSVYECACLQGLEPKCINWKEQSSNKLYPDFFIRDVLGEAIPASFTKIVGTHLQELVLKSKKASFN